MANEERLDEIDARLNRMEEKFALLEHFLAKAAERSEEAARRLEKTLGRFSTKAPGEIIAKGLAEQQEAIGRAVAEA